MAKKRRAGDPLTPLRQALRRLDKSDTYMKRRNARNAVAAEIRALQDWIAQEYPKLRRDGTEIRPPSPRGAYCPICRTPMASWVSLVHHLAGKHPAYVWAIASVGTPMTARRPEIIQAKGTKFRCCCGYPEDTSERRYAARARIATHLANQKDLGAHFAEARLAEAAK